MGMQDLAIGWLLPVARRVFALDPRIRAVCWTLHRDGDEVLEDWIPGAHAEPRWPDVLDDNPWLDDDRLDEALTDACLDLKAPSLGGFDVGPEERVYAVITREGAVKWRIAPTAPTTGS